MPISRSQINQLLSSSLGSPYHEVAAELVNQAGSRFIVGTGPGYTTSALGSGTDVIVTKLNADGSLDTTWGSGGSLFQNYPSTRFYNHGVSPDNQGSMNHQTGVITYFGDQDTVLGATLDSNGSITVLSRYGSSQNNLALLRVQANGGIDSSFGNNGWAEVYSYQAESYRTGSLALNGGELIVTSQNDTFTFNSIGQLQVSNLSSTQPICFLIGTHIETEDGLVAIQDINRGIRISTPKSFAEVAWTGHQRRTPEFAAFQDYLPVKISAGSVDDNVPIRDLYLSPDHAVLIDGHLIHAKALVNGKSIVQMTEWEGDIEYYHIETEKHEIIFAEGLPCETFIDNVSREQFDNYAEYQALYPNTRMMKELPLPRVKFKRQLPLAIKQRLESRIIELDRQNKG